MGVNLHIERDENLEVVAGDGSNLKSYSVQEDSTPLDPGSSFGGVGQITITANTGPDSMLLLGEVVLNDGSRGRTTGTVRSLDDRDGDLNIVADSILGLLNSDHIVQPFVGTLRGAIQYYCDLVGIQNDVTVEASIANRAVAYPGWNGNVWVHIKQLLSKEQVEMALVYNRVIVRPLRTIVANTERLTTRSRSANNQGAARKIEIYYYNHAYKTQAEVYPIPGDDSTSVIYQVNAGETVTFSQEVNASLISVNQPVAVDFVNDRPYPGSAGVYSVAGNDGLPITAAQWQAQGGSVRVAITDDPHIIDITIVGASMTQYAPYRIAMSAGSNNFYNSLHITGTGVVWDKQKVVIPTGASNAVTGEEVGITVDNPFVSTLSQAYSLGAKTAANYAGLNYTLSGTAYDINRDDVSRDLIRATVKDFNDATPSGTTVGEFSNDWANSTVAQFDQFWQAIVDNIWENQLFGNAAGARVMTPDANFRIDTATTTESSVQFTASLDTLVQDFDPLWTGRTVADFSEFFAGKLTKDFSMIPLRSN